MSIPTLNTKTKIMAAAAATAGLGLAGLAASRLRARAVEKRNPAPGRFVEIRGVRLHVLQQGSGPDVLLIHGAAMMASEMILALGDALQGCRITAIDRPGHGWSDKRRRPSIQEQAELFRAAAEDLGLKTPTLVGHSLGGAVALAYGERFADEISGVVAIAPLAYPGWGLAHLGRALRGAPVIGPLLSNTTLALTDPAMLRVVIPLIFSPQKPTPAFREAIEIGMLARPSALVADGADFVRASLDLRRLSRRYADHPAAVHIVVGDKDRILKPARQAERLARTLPQARLTTRPGLGHMVHHFAPGAVAAAVADVRARSRGAPVQAAAA